MDEAFMALHQLLPNLLPLVEPIEHAELGIRQTVTGCFVETPIEIDIVVGADGTVGIGATPPLYHVMTSDLPVFHTIRVLVTSRDDDE